MGFRLNKQGNDELYAEVLAHRLHKFHRGCIARSARSLNKESIHVLASQVLYQHEFKQNLNTMSLVALAMVLST